MIAKRYLCFAACLQIAAKEEFGVELDQVRIADHLGVVLPAGSDSSGLIESGIKNIRFDSDPRSWGITPVVAEINALLNAHGGLECRFESISIFQDWEFEDRLLVLTQSGHIPIVGFEYQSLLGGTAPSLQGHCAAVMRVQPQRRPSSIELYDPGPDRTGRRIVNSESLYRSCRRRHGGIWSLCLDEFA
jgi:hypothetical protein